MALKPLIMLQGPGRGQATRRYRKWPVPGLSLLVMADDGGKGELAVRTSVAALAGLTGIVEPDPAAIAFS